MGLIPQLLYNTLVPRELLYTQNSFFYCMFFYAQNLQM
jgi:hypothetical protein